MSTSSAILEVRNLSVDFLLQDERVLAVRDVSFFMEPGKTLGLVGESGCGKTVSAYSILRLIAPPGKVVSGEVRYGGTDLLTISEDAIRSFRGKEIAMIFQEPMSSLNPVFRIGYQISESVQLHLGLDREKAQEYAVELLASVGIPSPSSRYNAYPHELSGGMRQRVMIAMALSASPRVLIADEPTTALDVTIQAQILELLLSLQKEKRMSMLLITHDLGIVANIADSVAIMYSGEIVETGTVKQIFSSPMHPYTLGLFKAIPKIGGKEKKLTPIPGSVPSITAPPHECVFYPRCFLHADECLKGAIPLTKKGPGRHVRCVRV